MTSDAASGSHSASGSLVTAPLVKALLPESEMPTHWYNIQADLPEQMAPHLHPGTKEPLGPEDLAPLFPMALIEQEVTGERYVEIPEEVREIYRLWRPSPLIRARRLEKALGTSARIYYKYEGTSPVGSHKPNTAVAQAYYNAAEGITKLTTETGAGQWGASLAFAGQAFGIEVEVWQVKASFESKPYRRMLMETFGASVHPSPSDLTEAGRSFLAKDPHTPGSLGMAVSEAVEVAAGDPEARYSLGSVLNHVCLHQTIIGEEALKQLEMFGEAAPDYVFGCAGGGSNLAGLAFPFIRENLAGAQTRIVAVEPTACPSMTEGEFRYDHGDVAGLTPLMKMYTLGQD
ncbi:TrpB-like pyridoxal phosphate-dependent enzyme, partial [Dietzia sp. Cai40]